MDSNTETHFRSSVLKCIDSGLDALGEVSKQVVYSYLAHNQLSRDKIPDDPGKFTVILRNLFGRGEEILEKTIVAELKRTFNITSSDEMLVDILAAVRLKRGSARQFGDIRGRVRKSHGLVGVGKV